MSLTAAILIARLRQPSTVAGLLTFVASVTGFALSEGVTAAIASAVAAILGVYEVVRNEHS